MEITLKFMQKTQATHKETYIEVTTKERPWQKKYKKVIVPVEKIEYRD